MIAAPIINSFVSGELSKRLGGRTDIQQYYQSAEEILNMIIEFYGGAKKAPGTYYVVETKDSSKDSRVSRFVFSDTQAYAIEIGDQYMRFCMNGGQIVKYTVWATGTVYAVGDFVKNTTYYYRCITAHTAGATFAGDAAYWEDTSWDNGIAYVVGDYVVESGVMYYCIEAHTSEATFDATELTHWVIRVIYEIPTPYLEADIWGLDIRTQKEDVLYIEHPDYPQAELSRTGHALWTLTEIDYSVGPARPGLMPENITDTYIHPSAAGGAGIILTASVAIFDETHEASIWKVNTGYVKIISVSAGGLKTVAVANVLYGGTLTGTGDYTNWSEGSWSEYRGYPRAACISEDRLIYGYTRSQPQTTWESATSAYHTFELGADDADGMSFRANTVKGEVINWLYPSNEILIGTGSGIHSLGTGSELALTPTTARIKDKSKDGASLIPPQQIGAYVYYWQKYNRILREYGISSDTLDYETKDATAFSEHISESGIVDMDYQQSPIGILWCVRADGKLAAFTRQIEQKVAGWSRHDTQGYYRSVAVIPKVSYDEVWFIVERTIGGSPKKYIEYMVAPEFDDIQDAFFVHSGLTSGSAKTITDITNAKPVVVTCANNFTVGDKVEIRGLVSRITGAIPEITVDAFEYATNLLAQTEWVSSDAASGYTSDLCTGGAAISGGDYNSGNEKKEGAFDNNTGTAWASSQLQPNVSGYAYIGYDLGAGVTKKIQRFTIKQSNDGNANITSVKLRYSDNGTDWTVLETFTINTTDDVQTCTVTPSSSYHRYWSLLANANPAGGSSFWRVQEIEMMEAVTQNLQCYSEPTIFHQGIYSMKVIALITNSLNDTLTRTISPTIDLTGVQEITFWSYASRTGSNIKIRFHDSGGTTTEITPNIAQVNTWQEVAVDLSGVSDANKNAIDSIIITIMNSDATNTFYIDGMFSTEVVAHEVGMTELNNNKYIIANVTAAHFELRDLNSVDIDGTGFTLYDIGGEARNSTNLILGLDHLAGEIVQIFADGAWHPDRTVSPAGTVTLNGYYAQVSIGLGYTARITSNDLEGSPGGITSQGRTKRVSEVAVNLYRSLNCKIGTADKMDEVDVRDVALPTTTITPLFTGKKNIPFPSGWDTEKKVVIEQDKCLPLHVLSLVLSMEVN